MKTPARPACSPKPSASGGPVSIAGETFERDVAALAKAVGHPARIRILRMLAERKECICGDLVDGIDLAQSTVSQHLLVLKKAGLIQGEVDGPRVCYCLNHEALRRFKILVAAL